MDNKKRRDSEQLYFCDKELFSEHLRARRLTQQINTADRTDIPTIDALVKELLGKSDNAFICPPFYCDYGYNIEVGKNFFANYNCTILDVAKVVIGDNCMLAPNVSIYTAGHPVDAELRATRLEFGIGITIGDNVWIGGNAVICPGVHIGDNVVIGAGSVVTKDIPSDVIAAGNPARVIRKLTEQDKKYYYKNRPLDEEAIAYIEKMKESGSSHQRHGE